MSLDLCITLSVIAALISSGGNGTRLIGFSTSHWWEHWYLLTCFWVCNEQIFGSIFCSHQWFFFWVRFRSVEVVLWTVAASCLIYLNDGLYVGPVGQPLIGSQDFPHDSLSTIFERVALSPSKCSLMMGGILARLAKTVFFSQMISSPVSLG